MDIIIYCTDDSFAEHKYAERIAEAGLEVKSRTLFNEKGEIYDYELHIELTMIEDLIKLQNAVGCGLVLTRDQEIEIYNSYRE